MSKKKKNTLQVNVEMSISNLLIKQNNNNKTKNYNFQCKKLRGC